MSHIKELRSLQNRLNELAADILGIAMNAPKIVPSLSLEEKASTVITLREIADALTNTRQKINAALEKIEEHLCRVLVDRDTLKFEHDGYRLYPSAEGFFEPPKITDAKFEAFYDWVKKNDAFIENATKNGAKRALKAVCEKLLEAGEPLPPNVSSFIRARIKLRRM